MFLYLGTFARFRAKYWKNVLQWPLHLHILFYLFTTFRLYEVQIVKHIGDKENILTCSYPWVHLPYLVVYSKKNQNGLIRFKILKLVKLILNFLYVKFYDPGSFTLAVIVKTPIGFFHWAIVMPCHNSDIQKRCSNGYQI